MNSKALLPALLLGSILSTSALAFPLPPKATPAAPSEGAPGNNPMPGGYADAEITPEITAVGRFAVFAQLKTQPARTAKPLTLVKVTKAATQVVAGTNYSLTMTVMEGKTTREATAVVYEDLQGNRSLTSWTWKK